MQIRKLTFFLGGLLFILCCAPQLGIAQPKNESELKKDAEKLFEDEDYGSAYKLYAQLVSLYPKDPEYNYRLGVCMIYTEPDKKKPFSYLQLAVNHPKDAPKDAKFYLAKTYHINYQFDQALKLYSEYKQIGGSNAKRLQVDREIEACTNGKRLLNNLSELHIIDKKQVGDEDYYRSYDMAIVGGKLLVKPDEFKTPLDKKKKDKSVIYLPQNSEKLFFSSYGEKGENGRDIYVVNKLNNGDWGKPQLLSKSINTAYDEDYPFLHPNGNVLYFCSKGHNSMGGYDIFKSTYNAETQQWSSPVNLDFPINSPDDDILFVTDSIEKTAFFSTGRYSPLGKIDVLKINTERRPIDVALIKGVITKQDGTPSPKSKITVKNAISGDIVNTYQVLSNGEYFMELPRGGKFIFSVESPDVSTQSDQVALPEAHSIRPFKQTITYENQALKITNYFDIESTEGSYLDMLDLIEKRAKLDVNDSQYSGPTVVSSTGDNTDIRAVATTNPTIEHQDPVTSKEMSYDQMLKIANEDAKESEDESKKLKEEADAAFTIANEKKLEAEQKQKEADAVLATANAMEQVAQKNEELTKANQAKEEAETATSLANSALNMAKKIEIDALNKQKEAELNKEYAKQLEILIKTKNNKDAITKLEQIQNQINELASQKSQSDELYSSLKAEATRKNQDIRETEEKSEALATSITNLKKEVEDVTKDMESTSDNDLKENAKAQITELNTDIDAKNKELQTTNEKIIKLKDEAEGLNQELELAKKIKKNNQESAIVSTTNTSTQTDTTTPVDNTPKVTQVTSSTFSNTDESTNNQLLQFNNYTDPTSIKLKNEANKEIEALNKKQDELDNLLAQQASSPVSSAKKIDSMMVVIDNLANQALEKRKLSITKTGTEKTDLIKDAQALENQVVSKRIGVSGELQTKNNSTFQNNTLDLRALIKLSANNRTDNVSTAELLSDEAKINFNQAQKIREEAKQYPTESAKVGIYNNAEEKEKEAIAKQDKAIALLLTANPNYTLKSKISNAPVSQADIAKKKDEISTAKVDAYMSVSKANQSEIKALEQQLKQSDAYNNSTDKDIVDIKQKVTALNDDVLSSISKAITVSNNEEKASLMLQANKKELEIVSLLNKANTITNKAVTNQNSAAVNPATNTTTVTNTNVNNVDVTPPTNTTIITNTTEVIPTVTTTSETPKDTSNARIKELLRQFQESQLDTLAAKNKAPNQLYAENNLRLLEFNDMAKAKRFTIPIIELYQEDAAKLIKEAQALRATASDSSLKLAEQKEADALTKQSKALYGYNLVFQNYISNPNFVPNLTINENDIDEARKLKDPSKVKVGATLKLKGIEIKSGNAYSDANPIPIDPKLPDGLLFKVQIGAFRRILPNNTFKGLSPIIGQKIPSGFIRYMAGDFDEYNIANAVKNDLRGLGYRDAFVVAYYNGIRIPLYEAMERLRKEGKNVTMSNTSTAGITLNSNFPDATQVEQIANPAAANTSSNTSSSNELPSPTLQIGKVNELGYTVQVGVFNYQVPSKQLFNLKPLFSEKLSNGLYRHTAGVYNQVDKVIEARQKVVELGIKDAFITAYIDGKRYTFSDGKKLQKESPNVKLAKENPIVFKNTNTTVVNTPVVAPVNTPPSQPVQTNTTVTTTAEIKPFTNGVTESPAPTSDNGVKVGEEGISYKVQIGAYKSEVPQDMAERYLKIKTWPIKNKVINGLYVYTIGNFNELQFANKLREMVAEFGIEDAFITVYKNGEKLYGAEAAQYIVR